jgi:hypothetical protein
MMDDMKGHKMMMMMMKMIHDITILYHMSPRTTCAILSQS